MLYILLYLLKYACPSIIDTPCFRNFGNSATGVVTTGRNKERTVF